jgi:hypothetical protein
MAKNPACIKARALWPTLKVGFKNFEKVLKSGHSPDWGSVQEQFVETGPFLVSRHHRRDLLGSFGGNGSQR